MRWRTLLLCLLLTLLSLLGLGAMFVAVVDFALKPVELMLALLELTLRAE